MKKSIFIPAALAVLSLAACSNGKDRPGADPVDYVNVLVGTLSKHSMSTGNTYPAIARPWGTHFWAPQTGRMGSGWCYVYTEDKIRGFKQTHQPSPWINDYGTFSIMPVTNGAYYDEDMRASWFSHKAETATPYFYSVYLADHDTFVEMAPTERAAAFRFTYPEREMSYIVLDAYKDSYVTVEGNRICGYASNNSGGVADNFANHFIVESDTPFETVEVINGDRSYAIVGFHTQRSQKVNLKVASSFISPEQAATNLEELDGLDVEAVAEAGRRTWNETLGRVKVSDPDEEHLRTFYSCLYRTLLFPRDLSEVTADGRRVHYSPHDGQVHDGYIFTDTGVWDTFRSLFALVDLIYPDQAEKIVEGLVNHYRESGLLPEWGSPGHRNCMVGNNSASVVAEAFLKGIPGDYETLWDAVVAGAHSWMEGTASGRRGYEYYDSLGYVPCDVGINESAARTLEYAYDDWCIYRFGKALGKDDALTAPYLAASGNYARIFNACRGWMQGRRSDGGWNEPFNPYKWGGDFTEGNSLHYSWSVFHDIQGLINLMGGYERFNEHIDTIFDMPPIYDDSYYGAVIHEIREMQIINMGNYAHGNQPVQHLLYLYDWSGQPWKTQYRVREVMDKLYAPTPDGYCGDEDNGQTSAWYVFSALGFYPVCPASCEYALGVPLFDKVVISLPSGKEIRIKAGDNSRANCYVKSLSVNGRAYGRNFVTHGTLKEGARMVWRLSGEPDYSRGSSPETSAPYSVSAAF